MVRSRHALESVSQRFGDKPPSRSLQTRSVDLKAPPKELKKSEMFEFLEEVTLLRSWTSLTMVDGIIQ